MENLRWILIFAGVAILVLLYLTGRQSGTARRQSDALNRTDGRGDRGQNPNNAPPQAPVDYPDPLMHGDNAFDPDPGHAQPVQQDQHFGDYVQPGQDHPDDIVFDDDNLQRPAGGLERKRTQSTASSAGGFGGISSKIEQFGKKLSPRRHDRVAASEQREGKKKKTKSYDSKIVTVHVVASEGQLLNGAQLLEQFEQRSYHFGDMNIFHSMHDGKTVFSVAKIVVPGTFDIDDVDSFQTPGISLILQLPGPVPADVAFEVLLSEAHELAQALDAHVLDADRSTLSKQTIQHMREGIYEFMHRQKYFNSVPS